LRCSRCPSPESWKWEKNLKGLSTRCNALVHFTLVCSNKQKMKEILNLHLVNDRFNSEKIRSNNNNQVRNRKDGANPIRQQNIQCALTVRPFLCFQIVQVPTNVDKKFLYFNVVSRDGNNKTITVEGGGVNASIVQSDIAATNGFVHIIDHVLGIPYTSVLEKLKTDPMLK
jgi:fasciclin 1